MPHVAVQDKADGHGQSDHNADQQIGEDDRGDRDGER